MAILRRSGPAWLLVLLAAGTVPAAAQSGQNPSFNLVNRGTVAIRELYFTPAGNANWGRNRLAGATIASGASYPARRRIDGNCIFDIRVVFADGRTEDRRGLDTCKIDDVAFGAAVVSGARKPADDPSVRLVNRGAQAIVEFHAVAAAATAPSSAWGENRLGGDTLPPQTDRQIPIARGACSYDLRVVFAGGRSMERRHADLCRIMELPVP